MTNLRLLCSWTSLNPRNLHHWSSNICSTNEFRCATMWASDFSFVADHPTERNPLMGPPPSSDVDAVYARLRVDDPDVMDRDELAAGTARIAQLKAWLDATQVRYTRRTRELAE